MNSEVERRKAEAIARTTFGVVTVDNRLRLDSEMRTTHWASPVRDAAVRAIRPRTCADKVPEHDADSLSRAACRRGVVVGSTGVRAGALDARAGCRVAQVTRMAGRLELHPEHRHQSARNVAGRHVRRGHDRS